MRVKHFQSIRMKYTMIVGFIVLIILLICNLTVFLFFTQVVRYEILSRDKILLSNQVDQIVTLNNEIKTMVQTIVLDEEVQNFCRLQNNLSNEEVYRFTDKLKAMNDSAFYVDSSVVIKNKKPIHSQFPFDESTFNMLETPWYNEMVEKNKINTFSNMYYANNGYFETNQMISYRTNIYDINNPTEQIGEYILNIAAEIFTANIQSKENDFYFILMEDRQILFDNESTKFDITNFPDVSNISGVEPWGSGYLLWQKIENTDWKLLKYVSNQQILGKSKYLLYFFLSIVPITVIISMIILFLLMKRLTHPIKLLTDEMEYFAKGKKDAHIEFHSGDELQVMAERFNWMVKSTNENVEQMLKDERIKKQIKFNMIMSKIHPHFIYNTLNSAIFLARKNQSHDVEDVLKSLIKILQDSMSVHKYQIMDTVAHEIEIVRAYEQIQKYKYKNKFVIEYLIDEACNSVILPKNILQPIVENSIFHGIAPKQGNGIITISIKVNDKKLILSISDDGVGMNEETLRKLKDGQGDSPIPIHSIGIGSIIERLDYLYDGDYSFQIYSSPDIGSETVIVLPTKVKVEKKLEVNYDED